MKDKKIPKDELENEIKLLEQEKEAYEQGIRKYWFNTDLQIQIRENLNYTIMRIAQLKTILQYDR